MISLYRATDPRRRPNYLGYGANLTSQMVADAESADFPLTFQQIEVLPDDLDLPDQARDLLDKARRTDRTWAVEWIPVRRTGTVVVEVSVYGLGGHPRAFWCWTRGELSSGPIPLPLAEAHRLLDEGAP